ncbi:MAG: TrkA family potassium uptake protein [Clostridia bacterium]
MNVIIVGCGKTGARLAKSLDDRGYDVSVLDNDASKLEMLEEGYSGLVTQGMMIDVDVLRNAGCDNADIAVIVTNSDNVNVMVARILDVEFGIKDVYVRILDVSREAVFKRFGVNTVCATRLETDIFFNLIVQHSEEVDSITLGRSSMQFSMDKPDKHDIGKGLREIYSKQGEMPFSLKRKNGDIHLANEPNLVIEEGDRVIFAII